MVAVEQPADRRGGQTVTGKAADQEPAFCDNICPAAFPSEALDLRYEALQFQPFQNGTLLRFLHAYPASATVI